MATSHNTCNTFIDLNGIPYVNAEYLDNTTIQQIDRSAIFSQITVDTQEPMRAIIDIRVDDIGTNISGALNSQGNNTKQKALLKMIAQHAERLGHKLPTLRKGLIVRVNYQIENAKTGRVVRSAIDDFRVENRQYFLDINSSNLNDNAVITCFSDTEVSSLSEFTHGFEPMNIRITNVQLFYEAVQDDIRDPMCHQSMIHHHCNHMDEHICCHGHHNPDLENYYMHKNMQNVHCMYEPNPCNYYGAKDVPMIANPSWCNVNRFYHFENDGRDLIIHGQEVYSNRTKVTLIPCGTVRVNRLFMINPAHRLVFKFCIWKNDITVVDNTSMIADALGATCHNMHIDMTDTDTALGKPLPHFIHPDDETFKRLFHKLQETDLDQNHNINQLIDITNSLSSTMMVLQSTVSSMQESINAILNRLDMNKPSEDESPAIDPTDPLNPGSSNEKEEPSNTLPETSDIDEGRKDNVDDTSIKENPSEDVETSDDQVNE